jgi:hypothetical protein
MESKLDSEIIYILYGKTLTTIDLELPMFSENLPWVEHFTKLKAACPFLHDLKLIFLICFRFTRNNIESENFN